MCMSLLAYVIPCLLAYFVSGTVKRFTNMHYIESLTVTKVLRALPIQLCPLLCTSSSPQKFSDLKLNIVNTKRRHGCLVLAENITFHPPKPRPSFVHYDLPSANTSSFVATFCLAHAHWSHSTLWDVACFSNCAVGAKSALWH